MLRSQALNRALSEVTAGVVDPESGNQRHPVTVACLLTTAGSVLSTEYANQAAEQSHGPKAMLYGLLGSSAFNQYNSASGITRYLGMCTNDVSMSIFAIPDTSELLLMLVSELETPMGEIKCIGEEMAAKLSSAGLAQVKMLESK